MESSQFIVERSEYVKKNVLRVLQNFKQLEREQQEEIPSFSTSELTPGAILGMGEFCVVREISRISISDNQNQEANKNMKSLIAQSCSQKNGKKYAVKCLHKAVTQIPSQFQIGITDLSIETKVLSALNHSNIIKICGYNKRDQFGPGYFIIIERLHFTLGKLMEEWRMNKTKTIFKKLSGRENKKNMKQTLSNIIRIALSISSALSYLHGKRLLHRDIKPDNIGFDILGEIKIFDFGLSTHLQKEKRDSNGLYCLTGNTGSRRYMAPEVAREEPYNELVDVYSLGIILWEMVANEISFEGYSLETHHVLVAEVGMRPDINSAWPKPIQDIIQQCWSHNYRERPTAQVLCSSLTEMSFENFDTSSFKSFRKVRDVKT